MRAKCGLAWALVWSVGACHTPMSAESYLQNEFALVPKGVDVEAEEREVRRVLRQRGLDVVSEVRGAGFVALGASNLSGSKTALRIITGRGVVLADDASSDDLFAAARVALDAEFAPALGDYVFVASERTSTRADRGCVTLTRILPDGNVVPAVLDVAPLGSRACVSSVAHGERGHLAATVAWPSLTMIETPEIQVELALADTPLGQEPARVPVIKLASAGAWLEAERARLMRVDVRGAPFSQRHAQGVARAALALLGGQDTAQQLSAYRVAIHLVPPGSLEQDMAVETADHIEHGWLDPSDEAPPAGDESVPPDAELIEPETPPSAEDDEPSP